MIGAVSHRPGPALLVLAWATLAASCAPPAVPAERAVPAGGLTRVVVNDRLAWPFRLSRLQVLVDRQKLLATSPGPGSAQPERYRGVLLRLRPGTHSVHVLAVVSHAPALRSSEDCVVQIRSHYPLRLGAQPAALTFDIFAADMTARLADRLRVEATARGEDHRAAGDADRSRGCRGRWPTPRVIDEVMAIAEGALAAARQERHVVKEHCLQDALARASLLLELAAGDPGASDPPDSDDPPAAAPPGADPRIGQELCMALGDLLDCAAHCRLPQLPSTHVTVQGDGCWGTEPLDLPEEPPTWDHWGPDHPRIR